jgi:hypothetical protein
MPHATWPARILLLVFAVLIVSQVLLAQRGKTLFIRRIAGLSAMEEAVGRAVEMGRGILMSPGLGGVDIITLQALAILSSVAKTAAQFGHRVTLPVRSAPLLPIAQEALEKTYRQAGRGEMFRPEDVPFLSGEQFAYAASLSGIIQRERPAATFLFGVFFAESLIIAENANMVGAIQVAGTTQTTQIPFFVASCDYVLIGDEFYAATAYLTREPTLLGSMVGQDYVKMLLLFLLVLGILMGMIGWVFQMPLYLNIFGSKDLEHFMDYFQQVAPAGGKK